jgi:alpha-L-rhamnosidase
MRLPLIPRSIHAMAWSVAGLTLILTGTLPLQAQNAASAAIVDTRGPTVVPGLKVLMNEEGIQAPGYTYTAPEAPKKWTGQWIHSTAPGTPNAFVCLMRKEVTLAEAPQQVRAWLTGNNYRLWINGQLVDRGPDDAGNDVNDDHPSKFWFYSQRDLTPFFHQGRNAIAVELIWGSGFQFQADVTEASGTTAIVSDASWHAINPGMLRSEKLPEEHNAFDKQPVIFDATQEPVGWQLPGFDDAKWPACAAGGAPGDGLTLSEVPPRMEVRYPFEKIIAVEGPVQVPEQPLTPGRPIVVNGDGSFTLLYNRALPAHYGIAVKGGKGARVYLSVSEVEKSSWGSWSSVVFLRDGRQYFESYDYRSVGRIKVTVTNVTSPVEIEDVSAVFCSQPLAYSGSFTCSDDYLNQVWKDCRWAVQICLQDKHLDSPLHQEPIGDWGDYLIEDLCSYCAFTNQQWLLRQDLRKFAAILHTAKEQTFMPSYTMLWLQTLMNYYDATGDKALVEELAPEVHALLDRTAGYVGKNGIVSEAPSYLFMDWVDIGGFPAHHPPAVIGQGYLTAFYYRGLAEGIRVAELTGNDARKAQYADLRTKLADAYNQELWNEGKGLYRDGKPFQTSVKPVPQILPADKQIETFSVQNNALAVLYDLAPADRQQEIMTQAMATKPLNVRPYFMHFVLGAIAHAGLFDTYTLQALRGWKIVPETQTFREMGDDGDYSHGWIATPLYQMSARVLGILPTGPGYETFAIRPMLGDLAFAKGQVPTPHGLVKVDWQRQDDQLTLAVTVPPGTHALLAFPLGTESGNPAIALDHRPLWDATRTTPPVPGVSAFKRVGKTVEMTLDPGDYQFLGTGLALSAKGKD